MKSLHTIVLLTIFQCLANSQTISPFIHVDQFGYLSNSEKVAVISNPQVGFNANDEYQAGQTFELKDATNDNTVHSGAIVVWNEGNVHGQSGDAGWWYDFSEYSAQGSYYVFDPSTSHRSANFEINANPYADVIQAATKMFYYNRCNAPKVEPFAQANWTDGDNFSQDVEVRSAMDQGNPATARDLTGGWFDAGDYNKYVTFTHNTLHQLLTSYEINPEIFTDDWNLPESNNSVPDLLDEIKWELDWLYKMINADGTVILKMGSLEYDVNDLSPPSNNSSPRYYTPTCSSASLSIASTYAHAAKIYAEIPGLAGFADTLQSDAVLCWNRFLDFYENDNLETNCDDQTVKAGDADWTAQDQINNAIVAAIHLFDLTREMRYSEFVRDNISLSDPFVNNFFGAQHTVFLEAVLLYTTIENADESTVTQILDLAQSTSSWENFSFTDVDLYRVDLPDWNYFWGSNMTTSNFANLSLTFARYNIVPALNDGLQRKASELIHYFHGINPQGLVYLSNMYGYGAERSANEIAHAWFIEGSDWDNALTSLYGPAPGYLSGGPNQGYSGALTPPANQPIQKAYLDYNDWFTDPAYEITEPAIYYQAAYIQLLTNFVTTDVVSSSSINTAQPEVGFEVFPNPNNGDFTISGNLENCAIEVFDMNSKIVFSVDRLSTSFVRCDLSSLSKGVYIIRAKNESNSQVQVKKLIKM